MAVQKQKTAAHHVHAKKRSGRHHNHGKHYLKVYWPYVPITLIIALGLFIGNWSPTVKNGVLAYATEMNVVSLLDATNTERASAGQDNLTLNNQLSSAAQSKANDMAARNYWSHTTPDGDEPWVFIQNAGYEYQKAGENLAYGFNSSQDVIVGWMNSDSHRLNMLDEGYTEVGFGFANARDYNNAGPETVVVAIYGTPAGMGVAPSTGSQGFNSLTPNAVEPQTKGVARVHTLTGSSLPWLTFAIGLTCGAVIIAVLFRHGVAVKRLVKEGEWYIAHHPWQDMALVTIVMIGYVLLQTDGVIR
ncbi:hypothetical protein CR970_02235 [Candidatus Saccharibacteria bacterium]|nr:MAG: hypothetical protein CR970_02235 [Candidatus Saccharibacteria bacterium]